MAYQTNSDEFFTFLQQILAENMVNETVQLLSVANSSDQTLEGDLKFLKLRANKKLMIPAGVTSPPIKDQVRDVIKLVEELKKAHARRTVQVTTPMELSKKAIRKSFASSTPTPRTTTTTSTATKAAATATTNTSFDTTTPKKKTRVWPWVLLFLLLGGGAAGYFFKDKILQNEYVQKVLPEGFLSDEVDSSTDDSKTTTSKKAKKKTTSKKKSSNPSSTTLGKYYIQIASYAKLDQALSKRKRIEMSFDRAIIVQKNIGNVPNFRVVIPGFSSKNHARNFINDRKVEKLYNGAFAQAFSRDCRDMAKEDSNIYICD